jgi:Na+/phosphate symporter
VPLGLIVLLIPGLLAVSWFAPGASFAEMLGLVPALSMALLALIGIIVLAIVRAPFSGPLAWVCVALAIATGALLRVRGWSSLPRGRLSYGSGVS